jgi:hypothetical protein
MANGSHRVFPGDLITSDRWNALADDLETALEQLEALDSSGALGTESVPALFGRTLSQARSILAQPSVNLNLARVLDVFGNVLVPALPTVQSRIVLGQTPVAHSLVQSGTGVDLLVSGVAGGSGPGSQAPVIESFGAASTRIGDVVVIIGQNFDLTPQNNQVTFDGFAAPPPTASTPSSISVRVPDDISGAPANPGETLSVDVVVTTENGPSNTMSHTIEPPLGQPVPTIASIDTSPYSTGVLGQPLVISGQDFGESIDDVLVFFNSTSVIPETVATDQLTVRVPNSLPELPTPGLMASFNVIVRVNDVRSDPAVPDLIIQRPVS